MGKRKSRQIDSAKSFQMQQRRTLYYSLQKDADLCAAIGACAATGDQITVAYHVFKHGWPEESWPHYTELFRDLMAWCNDPLVWPSLLPHFREVVASRKTNLHRLRSHKRSVVSIGRLNPNAFDKNSFLEQIPRHTCNRLPAGQEYPPRYFFISESDEILERNTSFLYRSNAADDRISRKYVRPLQPKRLKHDAKENESGMFFDGDNLVMIVVRDACPAPELVAFVDETICEIISTRNHIRKEDPGHLSQMGMSAGSRSAGCLDWVKNIRFRSRCVAEHAKNDCDASSSFAILWNLCRTILPDEIIRDIEIFMASMGPDLRMDGHGLMATDGTGKGEYSVLIKNQRWNFAASHLAPPAGVMASNYARHVHRESQPHKWAIALTTARHFASGVASVGAGGHFFLASYGIRVRAAANTLIAWRPDDWHATSLPLLNPTQSSQEYHQRGLAFVTSNRLPDAVRKYRMGLISKEERDSAILEYHDAAELQEEEKEVVEHVSTLRRSARLAAKAEKRSN